MQRSKRETADYFLYDCGLLEELKKYGRPHMVGSYRMDMMAWNDVDIDVENRDMLLEKLYELTTFILERFHPTWYEAKEERNSAGETVWFQGFETMMTGELWNFDIWFLSKENIEDTERYCDGIARRTTAEQKEAIVGIKKALIERGLYSYDGYRSIDVYQAVTDMGIETAEELLACYDIVRDRA